MKGDLARFRNGLFFVVCVTKIGPERVSPNTKNPVCAGLGRCRVKLLLILGTRSIRSDMNGSTRVGTLYAQTVEGPKHAVYSQL